MKKTASVSMVIILTVIILLYIQEQCFVPAQEQNQEMQQDVRNNTAEGNGFGNTEKNGAGITGNGNGAGSTEDRKSARAFAEEAGGKGDSCPLDEKYREVLLTYAEYLQKYCENIQYPLPLSYLKFDLVYIDADDIPELAIIPLPAHPDGVHIYVYNDGAVVETGEFGSRGWCKFKPYGNLICSDFFNMGEGFSSLYRIEGTESVELQTFRFWEIYRDNQYIETGYEVDGVEVSEEKYHEAWEKWNTEEMIAFGYDDAVLMDGIDDLYGELCRRIFFVKGHSCAGEIFSAGSKHSARGQYGDDSLTADNPFISKKAAQEDDSCLEEWQQAYLAYMDADEEYYSVEYAAEYAYSLIYVDDDDIPELMINTRSGAGGYLILTFHDSVLDVWRITPDVTYIERGNLICNSGGKMGYYYDNVYTIQDGKWVYVDGGIHGDGPNGIQLDENGDYIEFFYWDEEEHWNGEEITKEEYEAHLNAIYPTEQSVRPQEYYNLDEIRSVLWTGDVTSARHRYELIVENVTWEEAGRLCRERGGYLDHAPNDILEVAPSYAGRVGYICEYE